MAAGTDRSVYAFPVEVARFLQVEPADVRSMIEKDELPATRLHAPTRPVWRIYLPDFHRWLVERSRGVAAMANYADFVARFREAVAGGRVERSGS